MAPCRAADDDDVLLGHMASLFGTKRTERSDVPTAMGARARSVVTEPAALRPFATAPLRSPAASTRDARDAASGLPGIPPAAAPQFRSDIPGSSARRRSPPGGSRGAR